MISNLRVKEILMAIDNKQNLEIKDDIKDVCKIFMEQSLIHQLYSVFNVEYLKKYYLSGVLVRQYQDETMEEIKNIFNENQIDFVLLKGSFIKRFYPEHFLRLMGDIDILIRDKDLNFACELLQKHNFKKGYEWIHHVEFKKNNIELELHHKLFSTQYSWNSYFNNPWDNVVSINKHEYEFSPLYCYMYLLGHLAKHMLGDGAGLRPFIDFYYLFVLYSLI